MKKNTASEKNTTSEKKKIQTPAVADTRDWLAEIGVYLFFALILYLFFKSVYAFVLLPVGIVFYHRYNKKMLRKKYEQVLTSQFKDALLSLSAALRAGYSMENALREAFAEMKTMYSESAPICRELQLMCGQLGLGMPMEVIFENFAARNEEAEEIGTFTAVFAIAKRTGGDMVEILQTTANDIASKIDTKKEINVVVRSKRLEQNIMTLMPPLIILYVDLTSGSILAPLYQNLTGRLIMLVCLAVYIGACFLSRRIMRIEV